MEKHIGVKNGEKCKNKIAENQKMVLNVYPKMCQKFLKLICGSNIYNVAKNYLFHFSRS